jgi:hypothetical protein
VSVEEKDTETGISCTSNPFTLHEFSDLIDMQSEPDGYYRFIMNYQDHLTKFTILRPLKIKTAEEVAYQLMDILCIFGAPFILQSENGREFSNKVIENLADMRPGMKLVH